MIPELRAAFERAYETFACYEDPFDCARKSGVRHLLAQMTLEDWNLMHKWLDLMLNDSIAHRHFLPRILEWIYEANADEFDYWGLWNLKCHLSKQGWLQWPIEEKEVLRDVFGWWSCEALVQQNKNAPLSLLLEVADDLRSYLNPWIETRPVEVARRITEQNWVKPPPVLLDWVLQPLVEERLEAGFWAEPDGKHATLLSRTIELIRSLHPKT